MVDFAIKSDRRYTDEQLLEAMREAARLSGTDFVSASVFEHFTNISEGTAVKRFGTLRHFCKAAGLQPKYRRDVSLDELFQNLEAVWVKLGRQPSAKEMRQPLSPISISQYSRRFGKPWYDICSEFLIWRSGASSDVLGTNLPLLSPVNVPMAKEPRAISLSVRYEVLKRDSFKCQVCGRSPSTEPGCVLHVDHIEHWSKGGKAELSNLRALCAECNVGRGTRE